MMEHGELIPIYDADSEISALLYRSMLEEAGIDVEEIPYEEDWLEGVRQQGLHSKLVVAEEDAERARQLVEAFTQEASSGELAEEIPNNSTTDDGKKSAE